MEEHLLAETGRALYHPAAAETLFIEKPFLQNRFITEDRFKQYLESIGVGSQNLDDAYESYFREKKESGILSDLWIPIQFHEYVIGYIHIWIKEGIRPFESEVIDNLFRISKLLSRSLKTYGYFESGKVKNRPFGVKTKNISVSGLLFEHPSSEFANTLLPETEYTVKLITSHRTVNTTAKLIRRYNDDTHVCVGCYFADMEPDDQLFLFEYIYGITFTDDYAVYFRDKV